MPAESGVLVGFSVPVPQSLANGSHVLVIDMVGGDAFIDNIRFTGTFAPPPQGGLAAGGW